MTDIKRGDFVKSVAQATGLSPQRAKQVAREAGVDLGYAGRTLSKGQEKKAVAAVSGAIKKLGFKVVGSQNQETFKRKIAKSDNQFKQNSAKPAKTEAATDFLDRVRLGVPGSKDSGEKRQDAVVSGSALTRQDVKPETSQVEAKPKIMAQHVSLSDNFANIEAATRDTHSHEPIAPDIG